MSLFVRYSDYEVIHCKSEIEAKETLTLIMKQCKLELHLEKTRIAYCKDKDRIQEYPVTEFHFLGHTYKGVYIKCRYGKFRNNFIVTSSVKSCKALSDKSKELN